MRFLIVFALFLSSLPAEAAYSVAKEGYIFSIQPIIGWEKAVKFYPDIHYHERLIYGARVVGGKNTLAGEGEFTRGRDTEDFYKMALLRDPTVHIRDTTDRVKLGVRRTWAAPKFIAAYARAGGEASRNTHEFTNAGQTTVTTSPVKYAPYIGGGLRFAVLGKVSLYADGVVIIHDVHDYRRTEYQATGSLALDLF